MLIAREFIAYLSRQLIRRLSPQVIETSDLQAAAEVIANIIEDELAVEDRLNDEVRDLLSQYSEYMRRENVSYQEMFRKAKNALVQQKKIVKASGRDTGDAMKLSRDKINDISKKLVVEMKKSRDLRVKKRDDNDVRLEIVKAFVALTDGYAPNETLRRELFQSARTKLGAGVVPREIEIIASLPKTRSGKIMRRLLRSIAKDEEITQDISTLENPAILEQLRQKL